MNQPKEFFLKLPIKENKWNACNCRYISAYPQVIFECCLAQKKFPLVMMTTDLQRSKWISAYCFPVERMTLRIQHPRRRDCWLEKGGKVAQQKIGDLGQIVQRRAAARGAGGGPGHPGGPLLPGCAGFGGTGKGSPQRGGKAAAGNVRKSKGTELLNGWKLRSRVSSPLDLCRHVFC